jgi:hypothetical protein
MNTINNNTSGIKEVGDFLLIVYAIIMVSFTTHLSHVPVLRFISIFMLFIIFVFMHGFKIDRFFYYIIFIWFLINIFASYFNSTGFNFNAVLGYLVGLGIPYFILKIVGPSFWQKFEKAIFAFTIISTIIYIFNLIFPAFFISLSDFFQPITADVFKERYPLYWTSIIYTHSYDSNTPVDIVDVRNSGFMWEPGAYAMILAIAILYNLYTNGFVISKRILIYTLILAITFSTTGYICLFVLLIMYLIKTRNYFLWFCFAVLIIIGFSYLIKLDFLGPKLEKYITEQDTGVMGYKQSIGIYEVNRLAAFIIKVYQWTAYPLGYGVVADEKVKGIVDGVNGIGDILFRWGVIGIVFLFMSLNRFLKYLSISDNTSRSNYYFSMLVIFIFFFSNPIELHPLLFFIVFTPYIFKANIQFKKELNN